MQNGSIFLLCPVKKARRARGGCWGERGPSIGNVPGTTEEEAATRLGLTAHGDADPQGNRVYRTSEPVPRFFILRESLTLHAIPEDAFV